MTDFTNLQSVLQFLVGGGSSVVVMAALSYLAENWAKWHALPRWLKFVLPILLSALMAILAQILMGYADIVSTISPWYTIVAVAVMSWLSSQKTYSSVKSSGYGVSAREFYVIEEDDSIK